MGVGVNKLGHAMWRDEGKEPEEKRSTILGGHGGGVEGGGGQEGVMGDAHFMAVQHGLGHHVGLCCTYWGTWLLQHKNFCIQLGSSLA